MIGNNIVTDPTYLKLEANMRRRSLLSHLTLLAVFLLILIGSSIPPLAGETVFNHKDLPLTLPDGWTTQEIPSNFEKEVTVWLKSEKIVGTSVMVLLYKGWRYNYSSVRIGALKTIVAFYPKGQEMLKKPEKIKTNTRLTAMIEFRRGPSMPVGRRCFWKRRWASWRRKRVRFSCLVSRPAPPDHHWKKTSSK
jgi:hypothetical protein